METYGTVNIAGDRIEIKDIVQTKSNGRTITISTTVQDQYVITIENDESTGRNPFQHLTLSEESFGALYASLQLFLQCKDISMEDIMNKVPIGEYSITPNLKPV